MTRSGWQAVIALLGEAADTYIRAVERIEALDGPPADLRAELTALARAHTGIRRRWIAALADRLGPSMAVGLVVEVFSLLDLLIQMLEDFDGDGLSDADRHSLSVVLSMMAGLSERVATLVDTRSA